MKTLIQRIAPLIAIFVASSLVTLPGAGAWVDSSLAITTFGGTSNEETLSIAVDGNGNIISSGYFNGTADFNPGAGTESLTSLGSIDGFVSKLDSAGNFLWAKRIGNSGGDNAKSVAVDSNGNVLIAGDFSGTVDFDPSDGTTNLTSNGEGDIFISKFDPAGNFLWAKGFGGTSVDSGIFLAIDLSGNIAVTGIFSNAVDFDPGVGTSTLTSDGDWDIYVSKFDTNGNLLWSKRRGGTGRDIGDGVAFDSAGNVYSSGIFSGTVDFDPGLETSTLTSAGSNDVFLSKFGPSGNYLWARKFGGSSSDGSTPISVDATGNIYASGDFTGTVDFDPTDGELNLTAVGTKDNFISKIATFGNHIWTRRIGSSGSEATGARTAVDSSGNVFYTGDFSGTVDFDPGVETSTLTSAGLNDIFTSKIDSSGNFLWAKRFGSSAADRAQAIAVDIAGNVYSTGYFNGSADFDPTEGLLNVTSAGGRDIFISKLNSAGSALTLSMARIMSAADIAAALASQSAAEIAATAVRQEAEKQAARANISAAIKDAKTLTVDSFAQAQIPGVNASNIAEVQAELLALPEEARSDIKQVLKVAHKYEVVGKIGSDQVSQIYPNTFVEIGLIPENSKNKAALVNAVKKLSPADRDSFAEIKAAIEAASIAIQKRSDRLVKVLTGKSTRFGN